MAVNTQVDLALLADVKTYIGGTWTVDQEAELQREITALSATCTSYCSRRFILDNYTEVRNGTGTDKIVLRNSPVVSVSSVLVDNVAVPAASAPGKQDGYALDGACLYRGQCATWRRGSMNVVIAYSAGYTPINDPATTIPFDLQQSVIEAVADRYKRRTNIGILAKGIAGETITYGQISIPKSVAQVWDIYSAAAYGY